MIYISSDHGGFPLKNYLIATLNKTGVSLDDLGPKELNNEDDYQDFAINLVEKVKENTENRGILICRNGVGMSIVANRFKGIRAALSWSVEHAKSSRQHNNSNVLVLPADYLNETDAAEMVKAWVKTPFENVERRIRRLEKLNSL